jgi:hypothetical protein
MNVNYQKEVIDRKREDGREGGGGRKGGKKKRKEKGRGEGGRKQIEQKRISGQGRPEQLPKGDMVPQRRTS